MFDCNVQLLLGEASLNCRKSSGSISSNDTKYCVCSKWAFDCSIITSQHCATILKLCQPTASCAALLQLQLWMWRCSICGQLVLQENLSRACLLWEHLWSVFQECYIKYQQCFSKGFTFVSYNVRYPTVCFDFHIIAHILAKSQPSGIFARPVALKLFSLFCSQSKCHYGYKFLDFVVTYRHPLNMTCEANSNHILL